MTDPHQRSTVVPYLLVPGVATLLEFLSKAFDAHEVTRLPRPDGTIMHAEVRIGDATLMMGEPTADFGAMPGSLYLLVGDCDAVYRRALDCGGGSIMEPADRHPSGQRYGGVRDPSGNVWWIATHAET